jgi:mRNA interferase MazF
MPKAEYVPDRNHIVWLDFEPTKGKEIGKYRPCLVLSSNRYNKKTGLLICCPISTSIRNAPTEVAVNNMAQASVVAASIVQTLSWTDRKAKYAGKAEPGVLEATLQRLLPLMGAELLLNKND